MPWFLNGSFFFLLHVEGSSRKRCPCFSQGALCRWCLLPDLSLTTFISGGQERMGYPRKCHPSVSIRTLTVEELLTSFLFLGKSKAIFPEGPLKKNPKNSVYHGSLEKHYPKKVLLKTTACRGVNLSPGTRDFFFCKILACHLKT